MNAITNHGRDGLQSLTPDDLPPGTVFGLKESLTAEPHRYRCVLDVKGPNLAYATMLRANGQPAPDGYPMDQLAYGWVASDPVERCRCSAGQILNDPDRHSAFYPGRWHRASGNYGRRRLDWFTVDVDHGTIVLLTRLDEDGSWQEVAA